MTMDVLNKITQKTALYDSHLSLDAKMVSYAGFEMPISYTKGIQSECFFVREKAGIFDVSHMGEFVIKGENVLEYLQKMTINDVSKLKIGDAQYSAMCYEDGGIVDDLILYRKKDSYLMVVNAANIKKNLNWLNQNISNKIIVDDVSSDICLIALQGPASREILSNITDVNLEMPFYTFREGDVNGFPVMISRTGYTGELGFEIYGNEDAIISIWSDLIKWGANPTGLAARDILRLEMTYCLYGNDINKDTNPIEAGLNWITAINKGEFLGSKAICKLRESGPTKKLVAFRMEERGIPRAGYEIYNQNTKVGVVTSGAQSPILNYGIGLGYIDMPFNNIGNQIYIKVRDKKLAANIIKPPFIKNTSIYN